MKCEKKAIESNKKLLNPLLENGYEAVFHIVKVGWKSRKDNELGIESDHHHINHKSTPRPETIRLLFVIRRLAYSAAH